MNDTIESIANVLEHRCPDNAKLDGNDSESQDEYEENVHFDAAAVGVW